MTDREKLVTGLSQAAWGYFLLHFNFHLSINSARLELLPAFAGMLLLLSAVHKLSTERRDLALLRPLCILLAVWHFVDWVMAIFGTGLDGRFVLLDLLVTAATLYFYFQFLTDMAAIAEKYQPEGAELDRRIRRRRTGLLLLTTATDLIAELGMYLSERYAGLVLGTIFCLGVILLVLVVMIMCSLFQLRRCVRDREDLQ